MTRAQPPAFIWNFLVLRNKFLIIKRNAITPISQSVNSGFQISCQVKISNMLMTESESNPQPKLVKRIHSYTVSSILLFLHISLMIPRPPKKANERQGIRDKSVDDITRLGQAAGCALYNPVPFWGEDYLCLAS
jgi:hypothetical protein